MRLLVALAVVLLVGCAAPPQPVRVPVAEPPFDPIYHATPSCKTPRECEVMWSAASRMLQEMTTMRTRFATDTRIETFAPIRPGMLAGAIDRVPTGQTGYEVRLTVECYRYIDCTDTRRAGLRLFNRSVNLEVFKLRGYLPPPTVAQPQPTRIELPTPGAPSLTNSNSNCRWVTASKWSCD